MSVTNLPLQHRSAELVPVAPQDGEQNGVNRFKVLWTTGAAVRRYDWRSEQHYMEELDTASPSVRLERLNAGAAVLNSHNSWDLEDVIGAVVPGTARMKSGNGEAEVIIDDGPETSAILRKIKSGIIRSISVGYVVHRYEKTRVSGGIDTWRATDWEPYEISFVPIPADPGAGLRSADPKAPTFPCEFINNQRKEDPMPQVTDAEQAKTPSAKGAEAEANKARAHNPEPAPAPEEPAQPDAEQIRATERARGIEIREAVRAANLGEAFADKLCTDGVSVDKARALIINALADKQKSEAPETRSHSRVEVTTGDRDNFMRGASDWLLVKAGLAPMVEGHRKEAVKPGEFRGMTLLDLARECLERSGTRTRGLGKMELVATAFTQRSAITQSTSDFSVLLENTLNKVLLAAYATTPDTWTRFCTTGSVSDFRAHNRYRLGSFGTLDTVSESGEFKNKSIPDGAKESITAATKGNIINLSRQAIINDDMGAFNGLAARFGRAAKLSVEVDVYDLLKSNSGLGPTMGDGNTLFHASHGNITTGAALAAAALDADRVAMGSQTDPSGNEILDLSPSVLVLPKSLGGQARVINDSQYDPDTVANKGQMKANIAGRMFNDIVDSARLTGTRRYLFADPAIAPVIEVAFLDGQQEPYMEMQQGFRIDGVEWKVRLDYAVDAIDWRGAITNAGA